MFCFSIDERILCCPHSKDIGALVIKDLELGIEREKKAHATTIACMEINYQGDLLATASTKVYINTIIK